MFETILLMTSASVVTAIIMICWLKPPRPVEDELVIEMIKLIRSTKLPIQWVVDLCAFTYSMAEKLSQNTHKGHWAHLENSYFLFRLKEETDELSIEIKNDDPKKIIGEAADVANFAMMLSANAIRRIENEQSKRG